MIVLARLAKLRSINAAESGGDAIADSLFGHQNKFGKLTLTWYPEAFTKQVKITDMGMRPNNPPGSPGRSCESHHPGLPSHVALPLTLRALCCVQTASTRAPQSSSLVRPHKLW